MTGLPKPTAAPYIRTIVPDPFQAGTVLLRTQGRGIWRTSDAGITWTRVLRPADSGAILAHPFQAGTFHVFASELRRSTDHGATWQTFEPAAVNHFQGAMAVAADPATAGTYYSLHSSSAGVMEIRVSTDYGASSTTRAADIPEFETPGNNSLVLRVSADANRTLYWSGEDLYRSTDAGVTWQAAGLGRVIDIRIDPVDPATAYATGPGGLFRTTNSGNTWESIDVVIPGLAGIELSEIEIDPSDTSRLLVGTGRYGLPGAEYGPLRSDNDGQDWTFANSGMVSESSVCSVAIGESSQTVYAVVGSDRFDGGWSTARATLWRSTDHAATWLASSPPSSEPGVYCNVTGVAVDPADNQKVYVATEADGVFRSADGGATWAPANTGLTSLATKLVLVAPSNSQILYVQTEAGLFRSSDAAATWSMVNPGSFTTMDVDPFDAATLYADGGYEKSVDSGATFTDSPGVTMALGAWTAPELTLALSRSTPGRAYFDLYAVGGTTMPPTVFTREDLYRSDDSLETSTLVENNWERLFLAVDPVDGDVLFSGRGRSVDAGATWRSLVPSLPASVCNMAIDASNGRIYAGSRGVSWPAVSGFHRLAGVACSVNADCDDGNVCTTETCSAGTCLATAVVNGTPCMKDFACEPTGSCNNGVCSQVSTGCDDGNACTDDICGVGNSCGNYAVAGCTPCSNESQCDDSSACTDDSCSSGQCVHYVTCDDGDPCTANTCDGDQCVYVPVPEFCLEEHTLDENVKLTIKPRGDDVSLKLRSRATVIPAVERDTIGDPTVHGMSLDVFNADGSITHFEIPAGEGTPGWSVRGDVTAPAYRFRNPDAPGGPTPLSAAQLGRRKLQAQARAGVVLPDASALRIGIRVTSGNLIFCALMETDDPNEGRFNASRAVVTDCSDAALTP